jgi:hypothetical protein
MRSRSASRGACSTNARRRSKTGPAGGLGPRAVGDGRRGEYRRRSGGYLLKRKLHLVKVNVSRREDAMRDGIITAISFGVGWVAEKDTG